MSAFHRSFLAATLLCSLAATAHASGPHEGGVPGDVREVSRSVVGLNADVRLTLSPMHFGRTGLDEAWVEHLQRAWLARIGATAREGCADEPADPSDWCPEPLPGQVRAVALWARAPASAGLKLKPGVKVGQWTRLVDLLAPSPIVPQRPWEPRVPMAPVSGTVTGIAQPGIGQGGLTGKHVYLSPGHGFTWTQNLTKWTTQRGNTHDLVEDLLNAEAALHYLAPMLWNAGARVVTMRERDLNPAMALVDDGDAAGYSEPLGTFAKGTNPGFGNGKAPYEGTANPFVLGSYRTVLAVTGKATVSARFVPDIAKSGQFAVYLGYTAGSNRVPDAHVEVKHLGGSTHLRIDMTRHGQTWVYLGHYAFAAGVDASKGAVWLHNDTLSGKADRYLVADVVRFGGGMGDIARGTGKPPAAGPTSGRPRWEESCRTYAQFAGAPSTVYDASGDDPSDDVSCRSRFAAWDHEADEDAIYLSWHTNAPSPARGTSTYVYGTNAPDGTYQFSGTKGSDAFGKLVQKTMVGDIKALVDPKWKDRGVYTAWFGEINPNHNNEMPAALVEAAFHSTKEDADYLREPRFRHLLARSLYKAIAKYFAERDKVPLLLLPEPPQAVALVRSGPGKALLTWQPGEAGGVYGDPATAFLVQLSSDGMGFDAGVEVPGKSHTVTLPPGAEPLFARVVALNPGGKSFPSAVVGAVEGCPEAKRALVVAGFTRLDSGLAPWDDLSIHGLGKIQRLRQVRMNTFDYAVLHVQALAKAGLGVDTAEPAAATEAVLAGHALVDWAAGEQSVADGVLDAAEKKRLVEWLQAAPNRTLWLNGAKVAYALDAKGGPGGGDWLETWFGARFQAEDAGTYLLEAVAGGGLTAGDWTFDDGKQHAYDVDSPDVLTAKGGVAVLAYAGGKGVAAVRKDLGGGARTLLLAVPLETVWPEAKRLALTAQWVALTVTASPCAVKPDPGADAGIMPKEDAGGADAAGGPDASEGPDAKGETVAGEDVAAAEVAGDDAAAAGVDAGAVADAGALADAGAVADAAGDVAVGSAPQPVVDDGCGCRVAGGSRAAPWGAMALAGLALMAWLGLRRRGRPGSD